MSSLDLSTIPALPPPEGHTSNFVNPVDRGPSYIAVKSVLLVITTIFVFVRLWARVIVQRSPWWDDFSCVLALLCHGAYCGINIYLCLHGVGRHMWNVSALQVMRIIKPAQVMAAVTETAIGFTKLTLVLFYYRLFSRHLATKMGIFAGLALIVPLYTILFFLFIFLDIPAQTIMNQVMGIFNVITDFYLLVLPLPAVMGLHLAPRKKAGLIALFSTGFFACVMSIVGAVYRFKYSDDSTDFTWALWPVVLVNSIECCVGIMCACLPTFPAVVNHQPMFPSSGWFLTTWRSVRERLISSRGSRSRVPSVNGREHNYFQKGSMSNNSLVPGRLNKGDHADPMELSIRGTRADGFQENGTSTMIGSGNHQSNFGPGSIAVRKDFGVDCVERQV